jgi:hypothetical protein
MVSLLHNEIRDDKNFYHSPARKARENKKAHCMGLK